jgi:hypothetical protein
MGYYRGTDEETLGGLDGGPGCSCAPCRRAVHRGIGLAPTPVALPRSAVVTPLPPTGPGYSTYGPPDHRYGTSETILAIRRIGQDWLARHPSGPMIGVGDLSLLGGGVTPRHRAHQRGLELDIRPVRGDGRPGPARIDSPAYSRALTQELVDTIRANGVLSVRTILFNDRGVRGVRAWEGHDDHLHVGFQPPGAAATPTPRPAQAAAPPSEQQLIREALRRGIRDPNALTDRVFQGRHPERAGRRLTRQEPALAREWLGIRDRIIRPLLPSTGPPGLHAAPVVAPAALADLATFSRRYVADTRAASRVLDCADLAIELWIRFGEEHGVPIRFRIWDAARRRWQVVTGADFRTPADFIRYTQRNLGALGLQDNTSPVRGGHRSAVPGDVYLWEYRHATSGRRHRHGHTQIVQGVVQGTGGPDSDRITVAQGNLPPIVPELRTFPASHFAAPRAVTLGGQPHIGTVVGGGPRRFNGFRGLT